MQIIKPKRLGLIHKTYHLKYHHFSVGALAFFPLTGALAETGALLEEFDQWPKCMSQLPMGEPLDMGFAKPRSEVLMSTKGHFHQHGLMYRCKAGVQIDKIKKSVRVSRRNKTLLNQFMPQDITGRQRSKYNGTYDKHWLDNIHPGFPEDTNTLLFNSAMPDQQLKSSFLKSNYFQAGCAYQLKDVHPEEKLLEGKLPDINVRIFTNLKQEVLNPNSECHFHELDTVLETVWFFPEVNLGVAIFRGVIEVHDSDALDVKELMLAYENTADKPRELSYYQKVLKLRTNPDTAVAHVFNESQLMPVKTDDEIKAMDELIAADEKQHQEKVAKLKQQYIQQATDVVNDSMPAGCPGSSETYAALANTDNNDDSEYQLASIPNAVLESGDFDLTPLIESGKALNNKLEKELQQRQEELQKVADSYEEKYKDDKPAVEESLDEIKHRIIHPVYVVAEDLKVQQAGDNSLKQMMNNLPQEAKQQLGQQENFDANELADAYGKLLTMQRQARQVAPSLTVKRNVSAEIQQQVRHWIKELIENGQSLAGRDFSGINLSGMDLSNLDLRDVMLEDCDLTGCNFTQSKMNGAVLVGSTLDRACFAQVDLSKGNLSQSKGSHINFSHAQLNFTSMLKAQLIESCFDHMNSESMVASEADFTGSTFQRASIRNIQFMNSNLTQTQWAHAAIEACIFLKAILTKSAWVYANLNRCMLVDISAQNVRFTNAALKQVQFSNVGDLQYADFAYSKCTVCGFRGVNLSHLLAPYAIFIQCDFGEAQMNNANFTEALFKGSLFSMAQMENSHCYGTFFNEDIIRKVNFNGSDLQKAEFNQCTLAENSFEHSRTRNISLSPQTSLS